MGSTLQFPDEAAPPCIWQHRSTREVRAVDRFEFCRELALGAYVERPLGARGDFRAEFRYTATPAGTACAEIDIEPCVSRFGPDRQDAMVDLGVLNEGILRIRYGRDETTILRAGSAPVLFDPARAMTTASSRTEFTVLRLPRAAVVAALGGNVIPRRAAIRPLVPGPLATRVVARLRALRHAAQADQPTSAAAIDTTSALALVALAHARGARHRWPGGLHAALYRAARSELALRAADPRATVDAVAHVLGCSRAQLYRLFAAHGETVAGYLHEVRMRQAAFLLRAQPQLAIGVIALRCSYIEPAAFTKAFRRRFGLTPRDWRAAATPSPARPA